MKIKKMTTADVLPIRHQVLWPDKSPSFCEVKGDDSAIHYGVFNDNKLVCVASVFIYENEARLRKFATLPEYQGQGMGTKAIVHIINDLKRNNINYFWCDARTSAYSFYKKLGFNVDGGEFYKSGVSYFKMSISW
ncbi:GNAT family N-acetyltransferase [Shewanella intestini]|uniref:GNAT family N-acetyltransferase n=1 Tax=Shewanella intestini TaxID=2017544 RepID=A0ABS5I640_9GAMM|nr:GNAT family N-acetyltransferase [Shewanella intestini]MRG35062.1 GNAT family N-acetyltransferase [Shewanella sp. XMDDZSB0408]